MMLFFGWTAIDSSRYHTGITNISPRRLAPEFKRSERYLKATLAITQKELGNNNDLRLSKEMTMLLLVTDQRMREKGLECKAN